MTLTRTASGGRRSKPAPNRGNQPPTPAKSSLPCPERHRRRYRAFLVRLEGDFLGQHDVAHGEGEAALGHEAPAADGMALPVQLIDVLQASMVDAVTFAGFGTDDFEGRALLVLGELLGGEPFSEQDPGFGFGVEAVSRLCANGDTRVAFARLQPSGAADNLATANQSV